MITFVKGKAVEQYNILFEKAVRVLKDFYQNLPEGDPRSIIDINDIQIDHIAQYFHYMRDLTEIDMENNELKFTKLPIDEKNFKINLDTRKIEIPKELEDISVCGDEIAEIVYFEVDRYYDSTDLNEQDIIIEWINADGQKGYSRPYGKDVDIIPGKIVFGWPLSAKITAKEGNVKFAVRFYRADETPGSTGIVYSLSTVEHTIKIKSAININLQDIVDKKKEILEDDTMAIIRARAINSKNKDGAKPGEPVIFYIGEEVGGNAGLGDAVASDIMAHVVYINTDAQNDGDNVRISAGLYAAGDGITTGSFWKKYRYIDKATKQSVEGMQREVLTREEYESLVGEGEYADEAFLADTQWIDYALITVAEAQEEIASRSGDAPGIVYLVEDGTGYRKVSSEDVLAMDVNDSDLARLDFTAQISDVGIYQFEAQVVAGSNKETKNSDYILVFPPVKPKDVRIEGEHMMSDDGDGFAADVTAVNAPFGTELDEDVLPPEFVEYTPEKYPFDGTREWASYKWYHNINVKTPVDELSDEDYSQLSGTNKDLTVSEEGYYKCGIVGHLNNSASFEILSDPFRITRPASEFALTISGQNNYGDEISSVTDVGLGENANPNLYYGIEYDEDGQIKGLKVEVALADEDYCDNLTYNWYRYVCNTDDSGNEYRIDRADAVAAIRGEYRPDLNGSIAWPADVPVEGVDGAECVPNKDGVYFCVVTNTYNEDTEVMSSPFMAFNFNENK